jgi:ABC-2 type transport system permease protein
MHNVWLIARREYLERVRTKAFLVMTVLIPLLMGGLVFGSSLMNRSDQTNAHVAIVAPGTPAGAQFGADLQDELEHGRGGGMMADLIAPPSSRTLGNLQQEMKDKELDGYLWIDAAANKTSGMKFRYTPRSRSEARLKSVLSNAIGKVLTREGLVRDGMTRQQIDTVMAPVSVDSTQAGRDSETAVYTAYALFFIMYFIIMYYGMNVARSIIEEKTSRIFEVLLATVRPEEMMAGKVIGVGSVGLTQVAIWMIAFLLLANAPGIERLTGVPMHIPLAASQVGFFVLFFLLGFVLYSSIAAALGAMTNSEQELQQLNMALALPLATSMFGLGTVANNPNGVWPVFLSMFPFSSPLIMYLRLAIQPPPAWQVLVSIAILLTTAGAAIWLASRIYRVGILMYGKKPSVAELMRWIRYS